MNPLWIFLEKADLAAFQKAVEESNADPLQLRLDGTNIFTAAVLCNAPVNKKLELFSAVKKLYLKEGDCLQAYIDEEVEITTPTIKEPIIAKAVPFMCRCLNLLDMETLLTGLKERGVALSEEDKQDIKTHALEHNKFSTGRINTFFENF